MNRTIRQKILTAHGPTVHRRIVVARDVDLRHDLLRKHPAQGIANGDAFHLRDRRQAGADRGARPVYAQRVRVVAVQAAYRLRDAAHALLSSSRVLMLRKASASSSNATSTTLSAAYQASILLPPPAKK